jgi:D-aspartate ligase
VTPAGRPGAIAVGGDYQGLGIIRSLGRRGIPIRVVDDERSIGKFSRYATHSLHVPDLRDPIVAVEATLTAADRLGLDGCVSFPTRDEHVASFSLNRERLSAALRVPTPEWDVVKRACDKRNTYARAEELGIPTPRTWRLEEAEHVDRVDGEPPWAVKPAIKDGFVHKTKGKAWRGDCREELREQVGRAAALVGRGEVIVQELVPGGGESQYAYCALFRDGKPLASTVAQRRRQNPSSSGERARICGRPTPRRSSHATTCSPASSSWR